MPVDVFPPGPVDVATSLGTFSRWGEDGLDRWDGEVLVRTMPSGSAYAARSVGTLAAPAFEVTSEDPTAPGVVERLFLGDTVALADLAGRDPVIARLDAAHPGVRAVRTPDLFFALLRSITAQQVNLTFAATLRRRLADAYGRPVTVEGRSVQFLPADAVAGAEVTDLRAMQFSTRKAEYVIGVAGAVASGQISLAELAELDTDRAVERLSALRGIGRWSAEWILLRCLDRPVVAAGDLVVRKATGAAYLGGRMPSEAEVREATAHWGPAAGHAQQLLLTAYAAGTLPPVRTPVRVRTAR